MDVRSPDAYKTEALLSPAESEVDEMELAILASLEEEGRQMDKCASLWDSFQGMLSRLKRIGTYDKDVFHVYELLSISLYKYSYGICESFSEETHRYIQTHLKGIRFTEAEQEALNQALNRLRSGL